MDNHKIKNIVFDIHETKEDYFGLLQKNDIFFMCSLSIGDKLIYEGGMFFEVFEEMLRKSGKYYPFCCTYCGESGCIGIFSPVKCVHIRDEIVLLFREPLSEVCNICNNACDFSEKLFCPENLHCYRAYRLKKQQFADAVQKINDFF